MSKQYSRQQKQSQRILAIILRLDFQPFKKRLL